MKRRQRTQRRNRIAANLDERLRQALPPGWPESVHPVGCAHAQCVNCRGGGIRLITPFVVCACVYRFIFQVVVAKYHVLETPSWHANIQAGRGINVSRPGEEYRADVHLLAKRALCNPLERAAWPLVFDGMEVDEAVKYLRRVKAVAWDYNRGEYHHLRYTLMERVGRAWACGQPYGVFPTDQYLQTRRTTLDQLGRTRQTKFAYWDDRHFELPDRSIPDVRAERIEEEAVMESFQRAA